MKGAKGVKKLLFVTFVLALLLSLPAMAWAGGGAGTISGTVKGVLPNGETTACAGMTVMLNTPSVAIDATYTASDGSYGFVNVPVGTYNVLVYPMDGNNNYNADNHKNYRTALAFDLVVTADVNIVQDFTLVEQAQFFRLYGANRYLTAIAISQAGWTKASTVCIASGANYPDALALGPLAAACDSPILLTTPSQMSDDVLNEIKRLGPTKVYIAGSDKAVSANVAGQLADLPNPPTITRFAGVDRFDTARMIAAELRTIAGPPEMIVVVSGSSYADALSAGSLAAAKGWPILLTKKDYLPGPTAQAVKDSGASQTLIAGSDTVVSQAVANALPGVTRKGGKNRYETCALVARFATTQNCGLQHTGVAVGTKFPDALAATPFLARDHGLLLLSTTDTLPTPISDLLGLVKIQVNRVDTFGSGDSISEPVVIQIGDILR